MSDDADQAQGFETFRRDMALARALAPEPEHRPRALGQCVACSDEIEPERLAVHPGARRCLYCQEALERRRRICVRA